MLRWRHHSLYWSIYFIRLIKANCEASEASVMCVRVCVCFYVQEQFCTCIFCYKSSLSTHTHYSMLLCCPTCHPHPGERETKRKREGMIERETGRWRDGDEGGACSACLDVNNAPEGSAANCQLLIFVVSFNHLRLCPPPPRLPSLTPTPSTWHTPTPPPHSPCKEAHEYFTYLHLFSFPLLLHSVGLILRLSEFASFSHFRSYSGAHI